VVDRREPVGAPCGCNPDGRLDGVEMPSARTRGQLCMRPHRAFTRNIDALKRLGCTDGSVCSACGVRSR